ncbi:GNAT family N-acetyltransferase [Deinococcus detaillensis]|uniref:GNAT family N-acetyltransferase n=1 Tax=Deinococcus detaillensis TaxID=2592048 RepID=A0A553V408_9DEIO|nr:GNAT family N-acetyltransferase [Deinococcus detaillensis]TSA87223.1 GNAT family N-acetyltransferase [Deinococcus detaillensis]
MVVRDVSQGQILRYEVWQGEQRLALLEGQRLEPALWRFDRWDVSDGSKREAVRTDIVTFLGRQGRQHSPELLSGDRETQAEINALIEQAGWQIDRRKVFVRRELVERPGTKPVLTLLSLAEVGREHFVAALLAASQGDPFETSTAESAEADFDALIEGAGEQFDPAGWFVARHSGEEVGVLLPQLFPDEPSVGTLFYVGVSPQFRARGLGTALHAEGLRQLQLKGAGQYKGSTDVRNGAMRRVFAANGCREIYQQWFYRFVNS